jgi:hypothetical protein
VYDFGLTDEQFWNLTAAQFNALSRRFDNDSKRDDFRFANLISILANIHRDQEKRPQPFTALDFMPQYEGDEEEEKTPEIQGADGILAYLQAAFPPDLMKKIKEEQHG